MSRQLSHLTTLLQVLPIGGRVRRLLQIACQYSAVVIVVWLLSSGSHSSSLTHTNAAVLQVFTPSRFLMSISLSLLLCMCQWNLRKKLQVDHHA